MAGPMRKKRLNLDPYLREFCFSLAHRAEFWSMLPRKIIDVILVEGYEKVWGWFPANDRSDRESQGYLLALTQCEIRHRCG